MMFSPEVMDLCSISHFLLLDCGEFCGTQNHLTGAGGQPHSERKAMAMALCCPDVTQGGHFGSHRLRRWQMIPQLLGAFAEPEAAALVGASTIYGVVEC